MSTKPKRAAESSTTPAPGGSPGGLIVLNRAPFNAETPLADQMGLLTPNPSFYVRSHFPTPHLDVATWRLTVTGDGDRTAQVTYEELRSLPTRTILATLECAGNGRRFLNPPVAGEQWGYGAVSTAEWTGVPLKEVLAKAGILDRAQHVVIEGADKGRVPDVTGDIPFARRLDRDSALHPDTLLAFAMNGTLLSFEHGFPVRLVVPNWYGVASVKWITRITATSRPVPLHFQDDDYVIIHPERGDTTKTPLTTTRVRSVIVSPAPGARLPTGAHIIRGLAWSGAAPLASVEVSVDGGGSWETATFASDPEGYAWRRWEYVWHAGSAGPFRLCSRAREATGQTQPVEPEWNRLGYANNAIQIVPVQVE